VTFIVVMFKFLSFYQFTWKRKSKISLMTLVYNYRARRSKQFHQKSSDSKVRPIRFYYQIPYLLIRFQLSRVAICLVLHDIVYLFCCHCVWPHNVQNFRCAPPPHKTSCCVDQFCSTCDISQFWI